MERACPLPGGGVVEDEPVEPDAEVLLRRAASINTVTGSTSIWAAISSRSESVTAQPVRVHGDLLPPRAVDQEHRDRVPGFRATPLAGLEHLAGGLRTGDGPADWGWAVRRPLPGNHPGERERLSPGLDLAGPCRWRIDVDDLQHLDGITGRGTHGLHRVSTVAGMECGPSWLNASRWFSTYSSTVIGVLPPMAWT